MVSLNNIYLRTSHTHTHTETIMVVQTRGQQFKKKKNPIKMSDDHTVQLHLLVHTQHERSAVLPLCSLPKKIKNENTEQQIFKKHQNQRQVSLRKTSVFGLKKREEGNL